LQSGINFFEKSNMADEATVDKLGAGFDLEQRLVLLPPSAETMRE